MGGQRNFGFSRRASFEAGGAPAARRLLSVVAWIAAIAAAAVLWSLP